MVEANKKGEKREGFVVCMNNDMMENDRGESPME